MNVTELTRIDRAIEIPASPERVWRALTTASEICIWFRVTIDGEIAVGREVTMNYSGQLFKVRIVEMTAPTRFVWQWHPGEADAKVDYSREPRTTVTFTLEASGKGTRLSVAETGFDEISLTRRAKVHGDNSRGWSEVMTWIQQYVETAG